MVETVGMRSESSWLGKGWAAVRLIHPFPATLVVLLSTALLVVAHRGNPGAGFLLRAASTVASTQVATGALNDYLDRHVDAVGQRDKPIPAGLISARVAIALTFAGIIAFMPLAASFGPAAFAVITIAFSGGLTYDLWLKPTQFSIAGYAIGFLSLITWLWLIAGRFTAWFLLVYPAGFLVVLAAHLAQSLPDIESDRASGQFGLAVRLGARRTIQFIFVPYFLVGAGGLVLSARFGSWPAAILLSGGMGIGLWGVRLGRAAARHERARQTLFRVVAAGLAILAAGSLTALNSAN